MGRKSSKTSLILALAAMSLLITDSKTALTGTAQGVELCIRTVIPSLFPFFVISVLMTSTLLAHPIPFLKSLGRFCGIPAGSEGVLLLGLIGGYPVGAQAAAQAWRAGSISEKDARRMLGFCNNCGPSFLFGITAVLFRSMSTAWILWGIHLTSALLTGMLLPGKSKNHIEMPAKTAPIGLAEAVRSGIRNLSSVCGWILLARCVSAYLEKWVLTDVSILFRVCALSILELTNGCIALHQIESEYLRFLTVSTFLAFGGICVALQTVSAVGSLGTGWYFQGKCMQVSISIVLADIFGLFLYDDARLHPAFFIFLLISAVIVMQKRKKDIAFSGKLMYNQCQKIDSKEPLPCFSDAKCPNPAPTVLTEPKFPRDRSFASKKVS